ncbi:Homeobox-leucine zipper protein HDG10 [Clarias magur]|uniref:Homeobox-leucine zipper protein HDG10 n=1 Tax=Clarias magur TaxID=1594786 RepID=A0A8J4UGK7_CLAMG|nr:Homeobox-leucine zipper protein HDG10 [Clarias magur]
MPSGLLSGCLTESCSSTLPEKFIILVSCEQLKERQRDSLVISPPSRPFTEE